MSETPVKYAEQEFPVSSIIGGKQIAYIQDAINKLLPQYDINKNKVLNASIGAMAEEINDRHETGGDAITQYFSDGTNDTHTDLVKQYNDFKPIIDKYNKDINNKEAYKFSGTEKIFNGIARDYGLGNVQAFKAVDLLKDYNLKYNNTDPLGIKKYNNDYNKLINDLSDYSKDVNAKFTVLATQNAYEWAKNNVNNWNSLSDAQQEALSVYYYNIGLEQADKKKQAAGNNYNVTIDKNGNGQFDDVNDTPIAIEYLLNRNDLLGLLNNNNNISNLVMPFKSMDTMFSVGNKEVKYVDAGIYTVQEGTISRFFVNVNYMDKSVRDSYLQIDVPAELMKKILDGKVSSNKLLTSVMQIDYKVGDQEHRDFVGTVIEIGTLNNLSNTKEAIRHTGTNKTINGKNYALLSDTATVVIDGVTHTAGAIVEAGEIAYDALSDFLKGNYQNNIISNALSSALNNTFADIAGIIAGGGTVDATKILTTFAKRAGYGFIASSFTQTSAVQELTVHLNGGKTVNINNTTYIELKDGRNIAINADQKTDSNGNVFYEGKNASGQTVKISEAELSLGGTGKAAISGLLNFGIQAIKPSYRATTRYPVKPSNDNRLGHVLQSVA